MVLGGNKLERNKKEISVYFAFMNQMADNLIQ